MVLFGRGTLGRKVWGIGFLKICSFFNFCLFWFSYPFCVMIDLFWDELIFGVSLSGVWFCFVLLFCSFLLASSPCGRWGLLFSILLFIYFLSPCWRLGELFRVLRIDCLGVERWVERCGLLDVRNLLVASWSFVSLFFLSILRCGRFWFDLSWFFVFRFPMLGFVLFSFHILLYLRFGPVGVEICFSEMIFPFL